MLERPGAERHLSPRQFLQVTGMIESEYNRRRRLDEVTEEVDRPQSDQPLPEEVIIGQRSFNAPAQ